MTVYLAFLLQTSVVFLLTDRAYGSLTVIMFLLYKLHQQQSQTISTFGYVVLG